MLRTLKNLIGNRSPVRLLWHKGKAICAAMYYGFPARKLTVIGITGTDGKTTTVGMTAHILHKNGIQTGALSTAFFQMGEKIEWNATQKTSPSPFAIQKFLRELVSQHYTHAVLEISSHGLVQHRTLFTFPDVAAITNTSPEHLDYHGTMHQYRKDKSILFFMLRGKGTKVLNEDDETAHLYSEIPSEHTITYSASNHADLSLQDTKATPTGSSATLVSDAGTVPLQLNIPGTFNLQNALCAIGCASAVGVSLPQATKALESFAGVPGRFERIDEGQPFSVYVDFTVTPGSYEATLKTLREMIGPDKRILVLTGSCGDRMREKRPQVGRICSELADVVIVTNEDPYTEDPEKIIKEVYSGVDTTKCASHQVGDRRKAIELIFRNAQEGDAVLLAGKGSDTTMWVADGQIPWNEREIAREMLREMGGRG